MRMYWLRGGMLLAVLTFLGCGGSVSPPAEIADETRLPESIDVKVADLLGKPRSELAQTVEDRTETLRQTVDFQRSTNATVDLLPDLKPALSPPVFRAVKYSKKLDVSLPIYLAEDKSDRDVALHLARYGDVDAAKKVAGSGDPAFLEQLEQLRCERNYSVEWTRLVALHFFDAELKLARGEVEGAAEIVHLHRQLEQLLDPKAKAGPLGAALLPIGRRALTMAASAYREGPTKKNLLADDIDKALADWKDVPPQPALALGAAKKDVAHYFRKPQQGRIFAATGAESVRALDLLDLPVPSEDVDGVVAFLDREDRLAEVLVYYHSNMRQNYPKPVQLAHHLVDHGGTGTQVAETPGVLRQTFVSGTQAYEVSVLLKFPSGSAATSAIIRVGDAKGNLAEPALPADARDMVGVHLDRSFDQNRLALDPTMKPGPVVETTRAVEKVRQPISNPKPSSVALAKEADADLVASVSVRWPADVNKEAMARLVLPLFAAYGGCRIEGVEDAQDGHLAFIWENDTTRYTFRLPYLDGNEPTLVAADRRGAEGIAQRKEAVATFDKGKRETRIKEGREFKRLDRWLIDRNVADVLLGMPKAEALLRLPKSQRIRQTEVPNGVSLFFLEPPHAQDPYTPRQMWVRFGPDDRVAEIRVRFYEGPAKPTKDKPSLLDWLKREPQGEPDTLTSRWSGLWSDLTKKGTPVLYRWRDDVTIMTYERDAGGTEVTIRDCPMDQPDGVTLPPLQFCTRGVDHCKLDDAKADVLKNWPDKLQTTPDGGFILGQPSTSAYDLVVVWFENDKVARVVARHRQVGAIKYNEVSKALQDAWSRDLDTLGVIRRQDAATSGQVLQGYGWHDDVTRVRIFSQDSDSGPRVLTEWRNWPVAVPKAVATK